MDATELLSDNLFRSRVLLWAEDYPLQQPELSTEAQKYQQTKDALLSLLTHPEQLRNLQSRLMQCPASQRLCPSYLLKDWFSYYDALLRCHQQISSAPLFRRFRVNRFEMLNKLQGWIDQYEQLSELCEIKTNQHLKMWPDFVALFHIRKIFRYLSAFWVQWHGMRPGDARKLMELLGLRTKARTEELETIELPWPPGFEPLCTFAKGTLPVQEHTEEDGQVLMYFQPVYDNESGRLHHCESLIRYRTGHRMMLPDEFFLSSRDPVRWALMGITALNHRIGHLQFPIALNVRCDDLMNVRVRQNLLSAIATARHTGQLIIELECSQVVEAGDQLLPVLGLLSDQKCRFSLDNCGIGPLPPRHLLSYFSVLKPHPYLLHDCMEDLAARVILDELSAYAQRHGMLTVAKHVDSRAIDVQQKQQGFDLAQGFFLGEPALNPPNAHAMAAAAS